MPTVFLSPFKKDNQAEKIDLLAVWQIEVFGRWAEDRASVIKTSFSSGPCDYFLSQQPLLDKHVIGSDLPEHAVV